MGAVGSATNTARAASRMTWSFRAAVRPRPASRAVRSMGPEHITRTKRSLLFRYHDRVLGLRALNRAALERQMLLRRWRLTVPDAVERLIGLQSQLPDPPYVGLWTRLEGFGREALTRLMHERHVVRS